MLRVGAGNEMTSEYFTNKETQEVEKIQEDRDRLTRELHRRVVDMDDVIEQLLICIFSGGHVLLIGVPGLGKTLLLRSLAELLELKFSRIQFTPDLKPSDITGTEILVQEEGQESRYFKFIEGPIFANIVLGDEINRTPPKTQAALLEAMEEHTVTSMGKRWQLQPPFFVLATQNPIEQEGTYPLPVAQADRFMFNLLLTYPSLEDEKKIMRTTLSQSTASLCPILSKERILNIFHLIRKVEVSPGVMNYAVTLCRKSRPHKDAPDFINDYVAWGASPRAAQCLLVGSKARAILRGNLQVSPEDIRAIFHPTMRHRILLNYRAESDSMTPDEILDRLLHTIPAPDGVFKKYLHKKYGSQLYLTKGR